MTSSFTAETGVSSLVSREKRLTRQTIIDAAIVLSRREGPQAITMRRLAAYLKADATAPYRHFSSKDELLQAMGDHIIGVALTGYSATDDWVENLRRLARAMYGACLSMPTVTPTLASSPPQGEHEFRMTELVLAELMGAGFRDRECALCYHGLMEYVVGLATIDAPAAAQDDGGAAVYEAVRRHYRGLDPAAHPATIAVANALYVNDREQFEFGLELLLEGLQRRASALPAREPRQP